MERVRYFGTLDSRRRITPDQLTRRGTHPELGSVTLSELLSTWVVHDLSHIAQADRVMCKQYSGAVGPWKYLPILVPTEGSNPGTTPKPTGRTVTSALTLSHSSLAATGPLSGTVLATLTGNGLNGPVQAAFDGERIMATNKDGDSV